MLGYRVGIPEETVAWKVLDFEYRELANEHTLADLANFLGLMKETPFADVPLYDWPATLAEFRKRYGDAEGEWLIGTPEEAIELYGDFSGGDVYQVMYDPKNIVVDLGGDGFFVLYPTAIPDYEYKPRGHRKERAILLRISRQP